MNEKEAIQELQRTYPKAIRYGAATQHEAVNGQTTPSMTYGVHVFVIGSFFSAISFLDFEDAIRNLRGKVNAANDDISRAPAA